MSVTPVTPNTDAVLDAAKRCVERWGMAKVTIDDIAADAGVSRATLYRLFPGGKDVLYDAMRVRELEEFFTRLTGLVDGVDDLDELLGTATREFELLEKTNFPLTLNLYAGRALHVKLSSAQARFTRAQMESAAANP